MQRYGVSERHACSALRVHQSTVRRPSQKAEDEEALTQDIMDLWRLLSKEPFGVRLALREGLFNAQCIAKIATQRWS